MQNLRVFHAVSLFPIGFFFIPPFLHFSPGENRWEAGLAQKNLGSSYAEVAENLAAKRWDPEAAWAWDEWGPRWWEIWSWVFPKKYVVFIREIPQESKPPGPKPNQEFTD